MARLSLPAAEKGNPNAVSDAGVAVLLAEAAAQAAALNVKINLAWIEDDDFKQRRLGADRGGALRDRPSARRRCWPSPTARSDRTADERDIE